jgi:peptidoglycan/LPS O-acetylase OafA/YrhL
MRQKFLDGIRGWGAIFVLLYHVFCDGLPITPESGRALMPLLPFNGTFAVYVFFVISGFSLSIAFFFRKDYVSLSKIAIGRYFRLMIPIFAVCLLVQVVYSLGWVAPPADRFQPFRESLLFKPSFSYLIKFSTFDVFFNYDDTQSYAGPLWTMSTELKGSFLVIFSIAVLASARVRPWALLCFGLVLIYFKSAYSLFFIGALLADRFHAGTFSNIPQWLALACFMSGLAGVYYFRTKIDIRNMIIIVMLISGCISFNWIRDFVSNRLSQFLGLISFPLYLIHGPILLIVGSPAAQILQDSILGRILLNLLLIVISIAAAYAFSPVNEAAIAISRRISNVTMEFLIKRFKFIGIEGFRR